MRAVDELILDIRRRETPFYDRLYRLVKAIQSIPWREWKIGHVSGHATSLTGRRGY
jgi:hypothetical protein